MLESLIFADQIRGVHFNDQVIDRPKGVAVLLMEYKLTSSLDDDDKYCWYYRIPYKQISGELSLVKQKVSVSCPELPSSTASMKLSEVSSLKLKLEKFYLNLQFVHHKQTIAWTYALPNWQLGQIHEKYQSEKINKLFPAMSFLNISNDQSSEINEHFVGKIADRFSTKTAIECLHIDKNCQKVGEDQCDRCRFGWYQVVNRNCSIVGSRYCGQSHCGEKNEPACPRGTRVVDEEEWGICQSDLTPVWSADQILLCQ